MNHDLIGEKASLFDDFEKDVLEKVSTDLSESRIQKSMKNHIGLSEYKIQERAEKYGQYDERYGVFTESFLHLYADKAKQEYLRSYNYEFMRGSYYLNENSKNKVILKLVSNERAHELIMRDNVETRDLLEQLRKFIVLTDFYGKYDLLESIGGGNFGTVYKSKR